MFDSQSLFTLIWANEHSLCLPENCYVMVISESQWCPHCMKILTSCFLCSVWWLVFSPLVKQEHWRPWRKEEENSMTLCRLQSMYNNRFSQFYQEKQSINCNVFCCRGVLQSLIEKHFPAPDRQKLYSLLGIDLPTKKTPIPAVTAAETEQKGKKRKGNVN